MQPTDHMSTAGVYLVEPINSSGGLPKHNVTKILEENFAQKYYLQDQKMNFSRKDHYQSSTSLGTLK